MKNFLFYAAPKFLLGFLLGLLLSSIYIFKKTAAAKANEEIIGSQLQRAIEIIKSKEVVILGNPNETASSIFRLNDFKANLFDLEEDLDINSLVAKCLELPEYAEFLLGAMLEKRVRRLGPSELEKFINLNIGSHLKFEAVNKTLNHLVASDAILAYRSLEKLSFFDIDLATAALIRRKAMELPSAQLVDDIKALPPGVRQNFTLRQTLNLWTAERMDSYLASQEFSNMDPGDKLWFLIESRGTIINKSAAGFFGSLTNFEDNAASTAIESGIKQMNFEKISFPQLFKQIPPQYRQFALEAIRGQISSNKELTDKFKSALKEVVY